MAETETVRSEEGEEEAAASSTSCRPDSCLSSSSCCAPAPLDCVSRREREGPKRRAEEKKAQSSARWNARIRAEGRRRVGAAGPSGGPSRPPMPCSPG
eukprot:261039-Rhodomonas_salina.4